MQFLGIEKFGTFLVDGLVRALPTRPWFTDNYPGNLSERGRGDILYLPPSKDFGLSNSIDNPDFHINWIHIKDGAKHIYISTKVLLTSVSWDDLNARGMIKGTPVTIDGKEYKLRVLTGGTLAPRNEWDRIVQNTDSIARIPKPTAEDVTATNTYGQLDGASNQMWNWWGVRTICQENDYSRGYTSVSGYSALGVTDRTLAMGWRPVLERTESDPPGKPIIDYPVGTEDSPIVIDEDPIRVVTQFNNPGGEFQWMDIEVFDINQNKNIVQNANVANTEYFIRSGTVKGNKYRIKLRHQNKTCQYSPYVESYFIYGQLNKYKLSEPVTVKQYDKVKTYTGGENLKMKPQTFPETENSVVRLVPQTMNTITAGETTTKELEFTASTKVPTIGDRLIKDKEVYTIGEIEKSIVETNTNSPILQVTSDATNSSLGWSGDASKHSYLYKGNIYFACRTPGQAMVYKVPVTGGTPQQTWGTAVSNSRGIALAGAGNILHVVVGSAKALNIRSINLDTGESLLSRLEIGTDPMGISATLDSKLGHLVVVMKGSDGTSTKPYGIIGYRIKVDGINAPTIYNMINIDVGYNNSELGNPFILDLGDYRSENLSVAYVRNYSEGKAQLIECLWVNDKVSRSTRAELTSTGTNNSCVFSTLHTNKLGERIFLIAHSYTNTEGINNLGVFKQKKNADGTLSSSVTELLHTGTNRMTTLKVTHDKEHGFILVYATENGLIRKVSTLGYDHAWSESELVGKVASRGTASLFDIVDFNPYKYGKYPGLLQLKFDSTSVADRLWLTADYILEEPKANKVILDKPISTQAGETIKFLDYDLEVKAKDSIATITPTEITDSYYEYDASFSKKESNRDLTIKGRNSKLTTLYYYNY